MKALGKLTTKWEVRQAKNGVAPNGMVLALVPVFFDFSRNFTSRIFQ